MSEVKMIVKKNLSSKNCISRRDFLTLSIGTLANFTFNGELVTNAYANSLSKQHIQLINGFKDNLSIPPLFCVAYITPDAPGQGNQEWAVARYPLTLVPQDIRPPYRKWRDKVKHINPRIYMLGYLVAIEQSLVPGPGHDKLREIKNSYCVYPDGFVPTVPEPYGAMRVFDPRNKEWQGKFLEACHATLASYPYDGLFMDHCTIFNIASPVPSVKEEMRVALQETLLILRKEFPNILLVGNSHYSWNGLNGEMNEGRPSDIKKELEPFAGHVLPRVELVLASLKDKYDLETVKKQMLLAHSHGGFYGASIDGQHILWFDIFDEVISEYKMK
jgi:hypothetical protein